MDERLCRVGDLDLCYEEFGDAGDPAMVLIMGLGTQMVAWPEDFCTALASHGFRVIRFDNRDIGRSTHLRGKGVPTLRDVALRSRRAAAYRLEDMADDTAGLLAALGIDRAHVVGASMGGMIAQLVAIRHPERTLSLASIMSSTGSRREGQPAMGMYVYFAQRPPRTREEAIERVLRIFRATGSRTFARDERELRAIAEISYERGGGDSGGSARQLQAIRIAPDRTPALRRLAVPTVVIHGSADRLVRPSGGRATARAIPGARLVMIEGMGHDLPAGAWPTVIDAIVGNARRAAPATDRV
jgi:pimeloyl-ACP methyl ester carboxylesterase